MKEADDGTQIEVDEVRLGNKLTQKENYTGT